MSKLRSRLGILAPAVALAMSGCAGNTSVPSLAQGTTAQSAAQNVAAQGLTGKAPMAQAMLSKTARPDAPAESVLYSFGSTSNDGYYPDSGLALDSSGNYYGTTEYGGVNGYGTVFKLSPSSNGYSETVIYSFGVYDYSYYSTEGVIVDSSGAVYGMTQSGGGSSCNCGTVFKLTPGPSGYTESILHTFQGGSDGANPQGQLAIDGNGNLYGVTSGGGLSSDGTAFELSPSGSTYSYKQLYAFQGSPNDGSYPSAGLLVTSNGTLFGTTNSGGKRNQGTVVELSPNGSGVYAESVVYSFNGPKKDLSDPSAPLISDPAGNLYGTTNFGGAKYYGGVFRLTPSGDSYKEAVIYSFKGGKKDGRYPTNGVSIDASGNLYGTSNEGGLKTAGLVYELSPTGSKDYKETVLIDFADAFGGGYPEGGVIIGPDGALYGTTSQGGANRDGVAFKIVI
jgi:uncharacterized repeat protein (TIGR03803 family)